MAKSIRIDIDSIGTTKKRGYTILNTRYYDPETCRFISPDDIVNLTYSMLSDDLSKNLYTYCGNNPVNMYAPDGKMWVSALNALKWFYADTNRIPDENIALIVLAANGGGIYTAFNETAQLVAAKQLAKMGMLTQLEYKTSAGEADIYAEKGFNKYLYEVKSFGCSVYTAKNQLKRYTEATAFIGGPKIVAKEIEFLPSITMDVFSAEAVLTSTEYTQLLSNYNERVGTGVIYYQFFKNKKKRKNKRIKKEVEEWRLKKCVSIGYWAGMAVAGVVILATLAEDVVTSGAGIANDIQSLNVTAKIFKRALSFGMLFI